MTNMHRRGSKPKPYTPHPTPYNPTPYTLDYPLFVSRAAEMHASNVRTQGCVKDIRDPKPQTLNPKP